MLTRLPTQRASEIDQFLPYRWMPTRFMQGDFGGRYFLAPVTFIQGSSLFRREYFNPCI